MPGRKIALEREMIMKVPDTLREVRPNPAKPQPPAAAPSVDDGLCMTCMERPPATRVLPCRHKVLCYECSERLRVQQHKTFYMTRCLQCTRPIERIVDERPIDLTTASPAASPTPPPSRQAGARAVQRY